MFPRICATILGRAARPPLTQGPIRTLTVAELETKGKYTLKVNVEPFQEKDIKYTIEQNQLKITGKRGETTGLSNWSHEMDTSVSLPPTLKRDTIKVKFDQGNVILEADSTAQ